MKCIFWGIATALSVIPLILVLGALLRIKMTPFTREILQILHNDSLMIAGFLLGLLLVLCGLYGLCVYLFRARDTDNVVLKETVKFILLGAIDIILMIGLWFGLGYLQPQISISSCFPEETLVATPSGNIPIGSLRENDIVYAYDTTRATVVETRVLNIINKTRTELLTINDNLRVTSEHPMVVISDGNIIWKEAGELSVGECLVSETGSCVNIHSITRQNFASPISVVNLSVSAPNNFFVIMGGEMVLVHNKTMVPPYLI